MLPAPLLIATPSFAQYQYIYSVTCVFSYLCVQLPVCLVLQATLASRIVLILR